MQLTNAGTPALPPAGARLLAAALALPALQPALAETQPERPVLSFKVLDYLDSQPDADRVRIKAPALSLQLPLGSRWGLGATAVYDAISGASPAYHTSGLTRLTDHRRAGDVSITRYGDDWTLTLGGSVSTESDYFSRGLSFTASRASEDRNTTWTFGAGGSADRINPGNRVVQDEHKQVLDAFVGLTQVLTPNDIVQANLALRRGRGYFSDPYKVFDQRPRERDHAALLLRWNHHLPATGGTLRSQWRFYADSFHIRSHTLGLEYVQPLPHGFAITPSVRLYDQNAARFYLDADPSAAPFVPNPPEGAVHYSQDQRLSAFGAATVGLKLAWQWGDWLLDAKVEQYRQRGSWRWLGSGSPDLAPFDARSWQLGLQHSF